MFTPEFSPRQREVKSTLGKWGDIARRQRSFNIRAYAIDSAEDWARHLMEADALSFEERLERAFEDLDKYIGREYRRWNTTLRSEFIVSNEEAETVRGRITNLRGLMVENRLQSGGIMDVSEGLIDLSGSQEGWYVSDGMGEFRMRASRSFLSANASFVDLDIFTEPCLRTDAMIYFETRASTGPEDLDFWLQVDFPMESREQAEQVFQEEREEDQDNKPSVDLPHWVDQSLVHYKGGKPRPLEAMTKEEFTVINYYLERIIYRLPTK